MDNNDKPVLTLNVNVEKAENGTYVAKAEGFPDIAAKGITQNDALKKLKPLVQDAFAKAEVYTYESYNGTRYRWNITGIIKFSVEKNLEVFEIDKFPLSENYFKRMHPELNRSYALGDTVDVDRPLLIIISESGALILIDGVHRLYKAWKEDLNMMPAYFFSMQEIAEYQINASIPLTVSGL